MVSIIAHELAETATDPRPPTGWVASNGMENADLCAWKYSNVKKTITGQWYNVVGPRGSKYLVQDNWSLRTNSCVNEA